MTTTRREFLTNAATAAVGAAAGENLAFGAEPPPQSQQKGPSDIALRVQSLESLLVERVSWIAPRWPRDERGAMFAEPWQAQAFAMTIRLAEKGCFTWKEWSASLAEELKAAADRGEPDDGSHYYEHWVAALERLVTSKGLTDTAALVERKEAWSEAYRRTPHGKPVELLPRKENPTT